MSSQYHIKNMKALVTSSGVALTANLYYGKTFLANVEDRGDGGAVLVRWDVDGRRHLDMIQHWWKQNCQGHWTARFMNDGDCTEMAIELLIEHAQLNKDAKKNIVFRSGEETYKRLNSNLSDLSTMMRILHDYPDAQCWNIETQKWSFIGSFFAESVSA